MKTIELQIDETGRGNLKDNPSRFDTVRESFESIDDLKNYLIERYGKMPKGRNKVFIDNKSGETIVKGIVSLCFYCTL